MTDQLQSMDVSSSTPPPTANQASALRDVLETVLSRLSQGPLSIDASQLSNWEDIVTQVTVLLKISSPNARDPKSNKCVTWVSENNEGIFTAVNSALFVLREIFLALNGMSSGSENLLKDTTSRMLRLCWHLDQWYLAADSYHNTTLTPGQMKKETYSTLAVVLRVFWAGTVKQTLVHTPLKTLRLVISECLDTCDEIVARFESITFPTLLMLFKIPRLKVVSEAELKTVSDKNFGILFETEPEMHNLLAFLFETVSVLIESQFSAHFFLSDLVERVYHCASVVFERCMPVSISSHSVEQIKALVRAINSVNTLHRNPDFSKPVSNLQYRLLQCRLEYRLEPVWETVDASLKTLFSSNTAPLPSNFELSAFLNRVGKGEYEEQTSQDLIVCYIQGCLPHSDYESVKLLFGLSSVDLVPLKSILKKDIERAMMRFSKESTPVDPNQTDRISHHARQDAIQKLADELVAPDRILWADEEDNDETSLNSRVNYHIQGRLQRTSEPIVEEDRIRMARNLRSLICLMSSCDSVTCLQLQNNDPSSLKSYFQFCRLLLNEKTQKATVKSRKEIYITLEYITKHGVVKEDETMRLLIDQLLVGVRDESRSIRLVAGRGLHAIMLSYSLISPAECDYIISRLWSIMDSESDDATETLLISVGSMTSISQPKVLARLIHLLIMQLGRINPVLRASACVCLRSAVERHNKGLYFLIQPVLADVALGVVQHMNTKPHILRLFARLAKVGAAEFLKMTLPYTIPTLFAAAKLGVLEAIAKEIGTDTCVLFVERTHEVLARIFLLPKNTDTTMALHFVMGLLNEVTAGGIDQTTIIRGSYIQLLAELVVVMGDNEELAAQALAKVHRILNPASYKTPDANATQDNDAVTSLLSPHALGLISYLNDMLQGSLGKKSLEMRRTIIRSLGCLLTYLGSSVTEVAPQMMATFQTMIVVPEFAEDTLRSWFAFLTALGPNEVGPYVAATTAAMVANWSLFTPASRDLAKQSLNYLVVVLGRQLGQHLDDVVDLSGIHELHHVFASLKELRKPSLPEVELQRILHRSSSYNLTVAFLSLQELKTFLLENRQEFMEKLMFGDIFDSQLGEILATIITASSRDGDGADIVRSLALECLGVLGAIDPDRCEIQYQDPTLVIIHNFSDEGEAMQFAIHLISDLLVGAFRATSDSVHQRHLAYAIQELLRFCKFSKPLLSNGQHASVPVKVRNRWNGLPGHVIETISPLLTGRFKLGSIPQSCSSLPIYPSQPTYREWIQVWTGNLVDNASGSTAQEIFNVFRACIRGKDVTIAYKLLPHLVLNILISGADQDAEAIRVEILAVLQDQVNKDSTSTPDKKLLSAQVIFMLLDHTNKWIRVVRQQMANKKSESKRTRVNHPDPVEEQLTRVDSILSSIDQSLMAKAAFQCRAFARSLMSYEQQILAFKQRTPIPDLTEYYERLHEIYAQLDEPDGMEGISTLIFSPSLEHKIRQHESTGKWTAAQSCWEVRLQQSPDNVDFHIGLLRCLRNLGHYDTLRTHVRGVLTRRPEWEQELAEFHIESAWMVGAWDDVRRTLERNHAQTPSMSLARVLLSIHEGNNATVFGEHLSAARALLGAPIAAAGVKGYRRAYDAALHLHLLHDLELTHAHISLLPVDPQSMSTQRQRDLLSDLSRTLSVRLEATQSNFRSREPILSMHRTVYALLSAAGRSFATEIGRTWLSSAKIARKAGHWQTAYSAVLQAQQSKARLSFIESAKLTYATEDPLRALHELENAMKSLGMLEISQNVLDLTVDDESQKLRAKAHVLRARWMGESDRYEAMAIVNAFTTAMQMQANWENVHFYSGRFQDAAYKALPEVDKFSRGIRMHLQTVRSYVKAIRYGSKYIYQTVPRLLTIWLDLGEDKESAKTDIFRKLNDMVSKAIKETPAYKWYTAFPQIVSRVGHSNPEVYKHLSGLITKVIAEYPKQALWLFTSAVKSTKANREKRGREIFNQLRSSPQTARTAVAQLVNQSLSMTNELLNLCDAYVENEKTALSMSKDFPRLSRLGQCDLIIPLQESLTATLPPTSDSESTHQPFPLNAPTFSGFLDEITIMHSLAKPRKITINGSDGKSYTFLGKPKDDLRKDARLMDFNAIINKLLKANSETRRRQLRIRTYGVVTLNEECGFIQWVPNTVPVRPVLNRYYESRRIRSWSNEMQSIFYKIKHTTEDKQGAQIFENEILTMFPPVFHEWFIETFPEPTAWLASRLTYARTMAVMCIVGFILGLGDRHCENILLDDTTGDLIHVDFNCLFEKGKNLETPERVPFRLTQNLVDGLGVTGVEGVFRIACELTLELLRDNKDTLMSVLDAFVHDPLVEWEDEKRKLERVRDSKHKRNSIKPTVDMHMLAKNALNPIEKKFRGIYTKGKEKLEKEMSTSNLVEALIQEATDNCNLAKMYPGWAPWH